MKKYFRILYIFLTVFSSINGFANELHEAAHSGNYTEVARLL